MSKKGLYVAVALAAVVAAVVAWRALKARRLPPEQAIGRVLDEVLGAAERGDVDDIMEHVSDHFQGETEGGTEVSRGELRAFLAMRLMRGGVDVKVLSEDIDVTSPTEATVTLKVLFTRGGLGGAMEGNVSARAVEIGFYETDGKWKVYSSRTGDVL